MLDLAQEEACMYAGYIDGSGQQTKERSATASLSLCFIACCMLQMRCGTGEAMVHGSIIDEDGPAETSTLRG